MACPQSRVHRRIGGSKGLTCATLKGCFFAPRADRCPDDRSVSIQYQDKEVRKKSKINDENSFNDLVPSMSGFYKNDMSNNNVIT
jgi:hypothetical protein